MKKLLCVVVALLCGLSAFAKAGETDLDVGFELGFATFPVNTGASGVTMECVNTSGAGINLASNYQITDYFGFFVDSSYLFPFSTEMVYSVGGTKTTLSNKDIFSANFMMNLILGFNGLIPVNEKFNVLLGGGFDMSMILSDSTLLNASELDYLFGLGLKAVGKYMFTERIGMNFGFVTDLMFGGCYFANINGFKNSGSLSGFSIQFRPVVGLTVKFAH